MKKSMFLFAIVAVLITTFTFQNVNMAIAHLSEEECDLLFINTLDNILDYENSENAQISSSKEIIYDIYLDPLGYIYLFTVNEESGYAIIIYNENEYKATEIYLNATNPYGVYEGQYIYVTTLIYLIYNNDTYIEPESGMVVSEEIISILAEKAYFSGDGFSYSTESVYFTYRSETNYEMVRRHPGYSPVGLTNACVPAAGGNIIGYYDRYYTELIPNFTPGNLMGGLYFYKPQDSNVNEAIDNLYTYMETNVDGPGTTITGFLNGMSTYCSGKGRNISFYSCMSGSTFSYNTAKQRIEQGEPIVLFLDGYNVIDLTLSSGVEVLDILTSSYPHAMAGFGYKDITYSLSGGGQRTDNYIAVATGLSARPRGFFNINFNTTIDQVYAINIS